MAEQPNAGRTLFAVGYLAIGAGFLFAAVREWKKAQTSAEKQGAVGSFAFGVGFFISGLQEWRKVPGSFLNRNALPASVAPVTSEQIAGMRRGLGDMPREESFYDAWKRTSGVISSSKKSTVYSIGQRADMIRDLIRKDSENPRIIEAAKAVVTRKCGERWCVDPKDYKGESDALFLATVDPRSPFAVRYTLDHPITDQYTAPNKTMSLRGEDCDGLVAYLGALMGSIGHKPELVILQAKGSSDWSHILLREPLGASDGLNDDQNAAYRYFDASMQDSKGWKPAGWEPPGLSNSLANGQPSGIVVKAKVYRVF